MTKGLRTACFNLALLLLCMQLTAQTPTLVKDINNGASASNYNLNGIVFNGNYIFPANDGVTGIELWITDASTGNTILLQDINAGSSDSDPRGFMIFNNTLYFVAYTPSLGNELWKTDGTPGGTVLVKDIFAGSNSGFVDYNGNFPIPLSKVWENNGSFYFIANNNNAVNYNNNIELWKTDGTTAGTVMVHDINPGNEGSYPHDFLVFNSTLFFIAYTTALGSELWKTDGTNTVLVKDIYTGSNSGFVDYNGNFSITFKNVWEHNGSFYFCANNNNAVAWGNNKELWKTDGTTAGTMMVYDINPGNEGSAPRDFLVFNNELLFKAYTTALGTELWKTDGNSTTMIKDIFTGINSGFVDYNGNSSIDLVNIWEQNGSFYFVANTGNAVAWNNNVELWKTDGTTGGTVMVFDINAGNEGSHPRDFVVFNNELLFKAYTTAQGTELWKTNGNSTVLIKDIMPGINSGFVDYNGNSSIYFRNIWEHNGSFYFIANNNDAVAWSNNVEIWKTDGTTAGTVMVYDINPGNEGSHPYSFLVLNNNLFFTAYTATQGRELWKTDGSSTVLVKDINPGTAGGLSTAFYNIINYGNIFYFTAEEIAGDEELWKTDGTTGGTVKVADIYPGANGSFPTSFTLLPNDNLIFMAQDGTHGYELWTLYLPGVTSVAEQSKPSFAVYPNPAYSSGKITIRQSNCKTTTGAYVGYDLTGHKVFEGTLHCTNNFNETEVVLPALSPGIYLLQIIDGSAIVTSERIIVFKSS